MTEEAFDTIVIGGGQAGLAMGYHLSRWNTSFIILEAASRLGESWRTRWDSLRLFTPAKYDGLPGLRFPGADFSFPAKDEVADYLERYAAHFDLPVRLSTKVETLSRVNGRYELVAGPHRFFADRVVVATGAFRQPAVPAFASSLDASIAQMHSSAYRNPGQLPGGSVLVAGAGNSGAEIALEVSAAGHRVWLSGRCPGQIPADTLGRLFGGRLYWWVINRLLSGSTPVGRSVRRKSLHHGSPLIRLKQVDVLRGNVEQVPRVAGVREGVPELEDGRVLTPSAVIWATGFQPGFDWIRLPIFDGHGLPLHDRGAARGFPGLYFLGLHFQHSLASALIGGVGADAAYVDRRIRTELRSADRQRAFRGRAGLTPAADGIARDASA